MRTPVLAALLLLAAGPARADAEAARHGLVPLPCAAAGSLQPMAARYCTDFKHYVTPDARAALAGAAAQVARRHAGAVVRFMEASWPQAERPMPPHLSHGDGREVDLALFYVDRAGAPLPRPPRSGAPIAAGYGAYDPPRREGERACVGVAGPHDRPDPPASRPWRLDAARTADLIAALSADARVRRIFVEPHLKARLGFAADAKVRFAGCKAARHDDHIHVDFR